MTKPPGCDDAARSLSWAPSVVDEDRRDGHFPNVPGLLAHGDFGRLSAQECQAWSRDFIFAARQMGFDHHLGGVAVALDRE